MKVLRKRTAKLAARRKDYDAKKLDGHKRPGSMSGRKT